MSMGEKATHNSQAARVLWMCPQTFALWRTSQCSHHHPGTKIQGVPAKKLHILKLSSFFLTLCKIQAISQKLIHSGSNYYPFY